MVPSGSASRQVLIWSVPTLVILLSLVWYRRKRNTLRTDPGGTSDSATKAKADKQTNGHVRHTPLSGSSSDLVQETVPEKLVVEEPVVVQASPVTAEEPCVVEEQVCVSSKVESLPEACVVEEQSCVSKKVESLPEASVVEEAACVSKVESLPEASVVEEAACVSKVESLPEASVVEEAACVSEVESLPEATIVEEAACVSNKVESLPEASVVEEAASVSKTVESLPEASVVEEAACVEEVVKASAVEVVFDKVKGVVEEAYFVLEEPAVPEEVVESVKVEEESAAPQKVVEESAAPEVEEPVSEVDSKEDLAGAESNRAMSEEDAACEGGAAAVVLQEEKVVALGGKLATLTLEEQRADADRDSANHSPVDAMLASPSLSNYSDEHSEGSSDSGKGCSDVASPPSRTPLGGSSLAGDAEADADAAGDADVRYTIYEFLLPHWLVGKLIGPRGSFVQEIKSKTNATVQVKKHPETNKQKICAVDGTQSEVDAALAMIRERYPIRKYPAVTLEQVCILSNVQPVCALIPEYCQLHLVEGVNNEVMVSCMVSPGHVFLQQPYHPTFQYLTRLSEAMNSVYSHADAPHVPEPITVGSICVAPATEGWYRVQVVSIDDENHSCEVKFVDHGGYMTTRNSSLRQIHHDFMSVPFQATECFLASIKPAGGSNVWSDEAVRLVDELTRGQMLYAQVYDYTEYSIPLVYIYCCINSLVVLVNQELVARGLAELDDVASAECVATEAAALVAAAAEVAPLTRQQTEGPSGVESV